MNKEKRLANYAVLVFSAVSFLLILLPLSPLIHSMRVFLSYGIYPMLSRGESSVYYLRGVPENFLTMLRADQENRLLKTRLMDFDVILAQYNEVMEENGRLRGLIGQTSMERWNGVWARVIERDASHWYSSFLISRGASAGIVPNDPVLGIRDGKTGLIGRVAEVYSETSKILLLTDELSSVVCYIRDKQWEGLIEGQGNGYLKLNYLPMDSQLSVGDEVVTSPASVVFPPGIPIGTIGRVYPKEAFMTFLSAEVSPGVRSEYAKEVYVIVRGRTKPEKIVVSGGEAK